MTDRTCGRAKVQLDIKEHDGGMMRLITMLVKSAKFGKSGKKENNKKYLDAMRSTRKVVYQAKCETQRNGFASASRRNNQKYEVFKMARWMVKSKSSIFDVGLDTKCASAYLFGNKL